MGFFNLLSGNTKTISIEEYLERNAIVIDVRTSMEFMEGHVQGSKNIPLDRIGSQLAEIKKYNKPVITCCRSGARSGSAANMLKQQGIMKTRKLSENEISSLIQQFCRNYFSLNSKNFIEFIHFFTHPTTNNY